MTSNFSRNKANYFSILIYTHDFLIRNMTNIAADTTYYDQIEGVEWLYKTNNRLAGRPLTNTIYDRRERAIKACVHNHRCMGVSQISEYFAV